MRAFILHRWWRFMSSTQLARFSRIDRIVDLPPNYKQNRISVSFQILRTLNVVFNFLCLFEIVQSDRSFPVLFAFISPKMVIFGWKHRPKYTIHIWLHLHRQYRYAGKLALQAKQSKWKFTHLCPSQFVDRHTFIIIISQWFFLRLTPPTQLSALIAIASTLIVLFINCEFAYI